MFDKIIKIFKSKKETMSDELSVQVLTERFKNHDFQWIKGDNFMGVVNFDRVTQQGDDFFVNFQDGSRIKYDILEEWMTWYPAPPKLEIKNEQPNQNKQQAQASVTSIKYEEDSQSVSSSKESPIYNLLARQKKKDVDIELKIKVPLPSKDLFNVLVSSFDDAENEIIEFIIDSIDIDQIRNTLSSSIRENYYGINTGKEKTKSSLKKIETDGE
jgi:hypothetical protein